MSCNSNYDGEMMKKGKKGENIIFDYLNSLKNIKHIINLSGVNEFRQPDIDFIIFNENFTPYTLEVKSDKRIDETGNIWWEIYRMYSDSGYYEGWATRSKAEFLLIFCEPTQNIYIYKFKLLRRKINEFKKNEKFKIKSVQTDQSCRTFGELIPLEFVKDILYKKINLYDSIDNSC